jgi:hypothetical protein
MFVPSQGWEESMDLGLKNKKALVTGASRGPEYATALAVSGEAR